MHKSSIMRFGWFFNEYKNYLKSISEGGIVKILDVGGKNYNGTYEEIFSSIKYQKDILDILDSPEVTYVPKDPYHWHEIEDETYDLVYAAQAFQHIDYFWLTILEMKRVLKKNGILLILAPSNRYDGKYPVADWAFNRDGLSALANWADLEVLEAVVAGIPDPSAGSEWDHPLDDAMLIALNGKSKNLTLLPHSHLQYERKCVDSNIEKIMLLIKWLELYQSKKSISCWLKKNGFLKVNVYGAGDLGNCLIKELISENIFIANVIDKNSPKRANKFITCHADEVNVKERKILTILTIPIREDFIDVMYNLKKLGFVNIISLMDILNECL